MRPASRIFEGNGVGGLSRGVSPHVHWGANISRALSHGLRRAAASGIAHRVSVLMPCAALRTGRAISTSSPTGEATGFAGAPGRRVHSTHL